MLRTTGFHSSAIQFATVAVGFAIRTANWADAWLATTCATSWFEILRQIVIAAVHERTKIDHY